MTEHTTGYCPACGRGDVAPTPEEYEQQRQRAAQAEADRETLGQAALGYQQRAWDAEAAIVRARHIADLIDAGAPWTASHQDTARRIREALTTDPAVSDPAGHVYLSTGCWHGDHDYCKSMTGLNGRKRPGECKKCAAKCICGCHKETTP